MLQNKIQTALQNAKNRGDDEGGFTLIELLVVILIIGILAAIALPTFLGQSDKAKDASAKSNARNLVSQVESCYATEQTYVNCDTETKLDSTTGLDYGAGAGQVEVTSVNAAVGYVITARSETNPVHIFTITKTAAGSDYACTPVGKGACPANGEWGPQN